MFKQLFRSKFIMLAIAVVSLLLPASLAAMPLEPAESSAAQTELAQSNDFFPMYSSYNLTDNGPTNCPFPQRFRFGTRTIYSYAPIASRVDLAAAVVWYALDAEGNIASDEPLAVATGELSAGSIPSANLSFNGNASGNVGVILFLNDGSEWIPAALGGYRIVGEGELAPEPGDCPLE